MVLENFQIVSSLLFWGKELELVVPPQLQRYLEEAGVFF